MTALLDILLDVLLVLGILAIFVVGSAVVGLVVAFMLSWDELS